MAQVTNLNIAPYYDDYDASDDFHKVLFRPGFAIQARELTTLQSILQNQIEKHGQHMFKEGTVVIPGQVAYSDSYYSLKLESTFAEEQVQLSQYINYNEPVIVTGETSGASGTTSGSTETITLANNNTVTMTSGYANPELDPDSGNIIYLENRKPIQRASDQTEDIKIIIEF